MDRRLHVSLEKDDQGVVLRALRRENLMKIAINKCFGGFDLSLVAQKMYCEKKGLGFFPYEQIKYSFKDGKNEYEHVSDLNKDGMGVHISNSFLGEKCEKIPRDSYWYYGDIDRTDKDLIETVEALGTSASGRLGNIQIVNIPDDIVWEIDDYDGVETVHEVHRSW